VNVYPRGQRDDEGEGIVLIRIRRKKGKLYVPDFFRRPPREKPLWVSEKIVCLRVPGKGMLYVLEFFSASAIEKTGYFSLPKAGNNRRETVKGLVF